jgi:hypothetical protein
MWPNGVLPGIGTGNPRIRPLGIEPSGLSMWCPATGWAVYADAAAPAPQHAIVRFGPMTALHGHEDRGSFTWWVGGADGVPVLTDPGLFDKGSAVRRAWAESHDAHSVLDRVGAPFRGRMTGEVTERPSGLRYMLTTSARSRPAVATRRLEFTGLAPVVSVSDVVEVPRGAEAFRYRQRFTLDPIWQRAEPVEPSESSPWPLGSQYRIATTADGHTLDLLCVTNGRVVAPKLRDIEVYPREGIATPALQAECQLRTFKDVRMQAVLLVDTNVSSSSFDFGRVVLETDRGRVRVDRHGALRIVPTG